MEKTIVKGKCEPAFNRVKDAFLKNFNKSGEIGASVSVHHEGKHVVNLWAGYSNSATKKEWKKDTIANIFSATKGITAICALKLVDQGKLDLDKNVSFYWPEFEANHKHNITVRMLLNHQAGLVGIKKSLHNRAIYDWKYMASTLADHKPWWIPGEKHGYHAVTYGWLTGEVIRRLSGKSVGQFLKDEIADPFNIDIQIGLKESEFARTAFMSPSLFPTIHKDMFSFVWPFVKNPKGAASRAFTNPISIITGVNSKSWKRAEIPSANGHCNAGALSKIYGILANGGKYEGKVLLSREIIDMCSNEESFGLDAVLNVSTRFSTGFMLSQKSKAGAFGTNLKNFGHPGAGGSLGFADPDAKLGFGYVMNQMDSFILVDPRAQRIFEEVYKCL